MVHVRRANQRAVALVTRMLRERWRDQRSISARPRLPEALFEVLVGVICVLAPLSILGPLSSHIEPTLAGVVFMVSIALATHLGEWLGALVATTLALLAIDAIWLGGSASVSLPEGASELATLVVVGGASLMLAWLIQEVKGQSLTARRDAQAARSATFALNSIEADAAAYARGGIGNRSAIYSSLLRAMVAANRTAFGALLLVNERGELVPVADYGLDARDVDDLAPRFLDEIVEERRLRTVSEVAFDPRFDDTEILRAGVRSIMGMPIFGDIDQIVGIVLTGLHAAHVFSSAEEYRLGALTDKASSILEALTAVDERELALKQARSQQVWLERVITAMPEAVLLIDPLSEYIIAQNEAAMTLLGDLAGKTIIDVYQRLRSQEDDPIGSEASPITLAIESGGVISSTELIAVRPDGAMIPVLVSAAPVQDPDDPAPAVVVVFREISALKEASRLKDEFVSIVSHELRSPLTPIRGFVQLVARDLRRKGGHEESVQRLDSAAGHVDRMTRLVDDLLDVSRLKAGLLDLRRTNVNMGDICREVINDRRAGGARHKIVLHDLPFDVVGNWDADRLYQVIDNLVGNAIKYSPPTGEISIVMNEDPRESTASVTVSDEGPGIAAEERAHLFSAFFRTKSAASGQVAGLGLGLYICQELITSHGGVISVHEADSGGAAFRITLPVAQVAHELEAGAPA